MADGASGCGGWGQCRSDVHTVHVNAVEAALRNAAADQSGLGQRWAIVGGFAVSARAEPRFTGDVDIAVAVVDDNAAESLLRRLLDRRYRLLASVAQDAVGRLTTARALIQAASDRDIEDARKAIDLITVRGFHPDRDLAAELTRLSGSR